MHTKTATCIYKKPGTNFYRLVHTCRVNGKYREAAEMLENIPHERRKAPICYILGIIYNLREGCHEML